MVDNWSSDKSASWIGTFLIDVNVTSGFLLSADLKEQFVITELPLGILQMISGTYNLESSESTD